MKRYVLLYSLLLIINNTNAQPGCTDVKATNYNASATTNDGSCRYNGANISPIATKNLDNALIETSGLIFWNNTLWSHNDDADTKLYSIDTSNASIIQSYTLTNTVNKDWEEISQDETYIYVGDFGNNSNGNRTDLHILRIEKNSLLYNSPLIDTINFSYSNQTNFSGTGANNTDFDCEAFLVTHDSIYLFTKQWISEKTSIYVLPKTPGTYVAQLRSTINIQGLATGITYLEDKRIVVICGYNKLLQPFFYLLYDFKNNDFANGNKRKIAVNLGFHQIEGIATNNGLKYYASNEKFSTLNVPQKLHTFDLNTFLGVYINGITTAISTTKNQARLSVFPNPTNAFLQVKINNALLGDAYTIYDYTGKIMLQNSLSSTNTTIDITNFSKGMYIICIDGKNDESIFIKQ